MFFKVVGNPNHVRMNDVKWVGIPMGGNSGSNGGYAQSANALRNAANSGFRGRGNNINDPNRLPNQLLQNNGGMRGAAQNSGSADMQGNGGRNNPGNAGGKDPDLSRAWRDLDVVRQKIDQLIEKVDNQ
jgi:hypothetical protein